MKTNKYNPRALPFIQLIYPLIFILLHSTVLLDAQVPFVTKWKTDNPGESNPTSITIPIHEDHTYNYDVDWDNDGIYDELGIQEKVTHDFGTAGTYKVSIRGSFPRIYFNNLGDKEKIVSIDQWGDIVWENMNSAFDGCSNLVEIATDAPNLSIVASMSEMFRRATSFTGDLSNWDVSSVPWMVSMFKNATLFNGDISGWDVSNVNSIRFMFDGATSFNQDISGWNVGKMETLQNTFRNASNFDQDLSDWDINQVMDMTGMFDNSGMSRVSYDRTLNGWARQDSLQPSVNLGAAGLTYCHSIHAKDTLSLAPNNWTITDGGEDCTDAVFITTWNTNLDEEGNTTIIRLYASSQFQYNFDIDWNNDGTFDDIGVTESIVHDYGSPGIYQVAIRGIYPRPRFLFGIEKLVSIDHWGEINWQTMSAAFSGCENLAGYNAPFPPDLSNVTDCSYMFSGCDLFNGDISNWNVGNVTDMSAMFHEAFSFNQDIGTWDVSNVIDMREMFAGRFNTSTSFNQDIGSWDVSNVQDLSSMFESNEIFNRDIGLWDVGGVMDMTSMFEGAIEFNQNIGNWNVQSVLSMESMFSEASTFNQDLGGWDVSQVLNMSSMFEEASSFNQDIGFWNVGNVRDMSSMFDSATEFNQPLELWDVSQVIDMSEMFYKAIAFDQEIGEWEVGQVTNMQSMFGSRITFDNTMFNRDISRWDVSKVTDMKEMFNHAFLFNQDISDWDVGHVVDMSGMFEGATSFNQDINEWNVSNVENMSSMFSNASSFNQDLESWDVNQVTTMRSMFRGGEVFNGDLSTWDTGLVNDMSFMFSDARLFNQDISNWNVSQVANISNMFSYAYGFNQDIGGWDTGNITNMERAFFISADFDQNLGNWDISNVTNMEVIFNSSGIGANNCDATLIGWATQTIEPNLIVGARNLNYCNGASAHDVLTNTPNNWTFQGDVLDCDNILPCPSTLENRWITSGSDSWFENSQNWSQVSTPTVCDDVVTASGVTIVVVHGKKAKCATLEIVEGGVFEVNQGALLEVYGN